MAEVLERPEVSDVTVAPDVATAAAATAAAATAATGGVEPTLAALTTRFVRTTVPRRLYQLLHLALPIAIDAATRGWWRTAGWSLALAAFGAWGLADRWLSESAAEHPTRARYIRAIRVVSGALAAVPPLVLLLEAFLRLLGKAPIS